MSVCICTPKQKDSGRHAKRCEAHHGYMSASAQMPKKRERELTKVERSVLGMLSTRFALFSRASLYNGSEDGGSYEQFGRVLQSMRKRGLIETNYKGSACWKITDAGRARARRKECNMHGDYRHPIHTHGDRK